METCHLLCARIFSTSPSLLDPENRQRDAGRSAKRRRLSSWLNGGVHCVEISSVGATVLRYRRAQWTLAERCGFWNLESTSDLTKDPRSRPQYAILDSLSLRIRNDKVYSPNDSSWIWNIYKRKRIKWITRQNATDDDCLQLHKITKTWLLITPQ